MTKVKRAQAAEAEKLRNMLNAYMVELHAQQVSTPGGPKRLPQWRLATRAGMLTIHPPALQSDFKTIEYNATPSICTAFDDPKFAAQVLHPGARIFPGAGQRLNPASGKWNFHGTWAVIIFDEFKRELAPLLVTRPLEAGT